ncbi:hypothetical protein RR11_2474 [Ruegeria sp. R11]|nr:hypothetical protein RR11_2474 [Ruegeria sp. R11]
MQAQIMRERTKVRFRCGCAFGGFEKAIRRSVVLGDLPNRT